MNTNKDLFELFFKTKTDFTSVFGETLAKLNETLIYGNEDIWYDYNKGNELVFQKE